LGQPNLTSGTSNNGGLSAQSLSIPTQVFTDGTRLFISDYGNNRVVFTTSLPSGLNVAAELVVGQPNLTSQLANNGGLGADTLYTPISAMSMGAKFLVSDYENNRVLIWNQVPQTNQTPADVVLGQPNMNIGNPNNGGRSAST